jgi:hypothetical protein
MAESEIFITNSSTGSTEVKNWLSSINLQEYNNYFEEEGHDQMEVLYKLNEKELDKLLDNAQIRKKGHRHLFRQQLQSYKESIETKTLSPDGGRINAQAASNFRQTSTYHLRYLLYLNFNI